MSLPSNSSLSAHLGVTITETMTWDMSWYGFQRDPLYVVFSISQSTEVELAGTFVRFGNGRCRAAWGWTLENQKVIPTMLVVFGLPERAVAVLLRWQSVIQSSGNDQTSLRNITKVILRENLLIQGRDLGLTGDIGEKSDVFGFPRVSVIDPSTRKGYTFKAMMTYRHHLQAPLEYLDSGTIPEHHKFDFPIFDGGIFPPASKSEVLGGGFVEW